jgi:hypothetical protein
VFIVNPLMIRVEPSKDDRTTSRMLGAIPSILVVVLWIDPHAKKIIRGIGVADSIHKALPMDRNF